MKKHTKFKLAILILLVILIIVELIAFKNSRANKIIEMNISLTDSDQVVDSVNQTWSALSDENENYYILLPEYIGSNRVSKYENTSSNINIEAKIANDIKETNATIENNTNYKAQGNDISNETVNPNNTINSNGTSSKNEEVANSKTYKPGDKIYLSQSDIENKSINLKVTYDKKENNGLSLYYKNINAEVNSRKIQIEGYMPEDSKIEAKEIGKEQVENELNQFLINNVSFKIAYDIKILKNDVEYEPSNYGEKVKVTITNISNEENKEYRVVHIEEKGEEVKGVEKVGKDLTFNTDEFSVYAILEESNLEVSTYSADSEISLNADIWDGTTSSGFKFGNGTKETPYLITKGQELKYLQEQVNSGNSFENVYFQLATDIDLNKNTWTPIGNSTNSFRGVFDGAGHIISNGVIYVTDVPDEKVESYGLFGSLGGGNSKAIIKNLEINKITVSIQASGDTGGGSGWMGDAPSNEEGFSIGTLVGTMYKNSQVINNIAKECTITDTGNLNIQDPKFRYAVGGLVGYAQNSNGNTSDPGSNARYEINNCFVNTNINLSATVDKNSSWWGGTGSEVSDAEYHAGGIIGTIRNQAVWPQNSLYVGSIDSNGFIGPIFGGLIASTSYDNTNNYATIWNGNDAGSLTMNSYYSSFSANGTNFNATVTTGTSTNRLSSSSSNIGRVQGVNKGIYTNNIQSLLTSFNNNAGNNYIKWNYENGTFSFNTRFNLSLDKTNKPTYIVNVEDSYSQGPFTYEWYLEENLVNELQNKNQVTQENSWERDYNYTVLVGDGSYYSVLDFTVKRYSLYLEFDINEANNSVTARLAGEALEFINPNDYTYQWYTLDIAGLSQDEIVGETSLTLNNLVEGQEYKLIGTNNTNYSLNVEGSFVYGDRTVIYVNYSGGNDRNNGYTPETAVKSLSTAYGKLDSNANRESNVIVLMGTYSNTSFYDSATSSTYAKNATITGIYGGTDYNANLYFYSGTNTYRYLNGDTTFQYLTFYGGRNSMYFYLQGYSLTMGEGITMNNYATANPNQGLLGNNAPAFHIICGWLRYNYAKLPRNNAKVIIKSGTYGRIIGGGSPGTTGASNLQQYTSHNFMGSSMEDSFKLDVTIDIKDSTTQSQYDYDVNLLVGGSACGNNYSVVNIDIKSGTVGRLCGGSIGDSSDRPNNWNYPINTFLGEATINITGGKVTELYGGCLGRNMDAIGGGWGASTIVCDSYFYGIATINISGGEIIENIYGAGAGGVTGYSENSSDEYKSYGREFNTSVNINISGGTINGDIYGGGYGYTEYLTENVTAEDSGTLYGDSNITITGSPLINGNIYAAGCGYDLSSKPYLAQMEGTSNISISGSPTINGQIFGAGAGISKYEDMAKLTGSSNITINCDLNSDVFGGGNNAKTEGTTNINIQGGNHTGSIYGGGNLGVVIGTTNVNIAGGQQESVFGGGNKADVTSSIINIKGGNTNTIYGGSNQTGTVQNTTINATSGSTTTIYGGNNVGGITQNAVVNIEGSSVNDSVYGGGNRVDTTNATVYLKSSGNNIPNIFGGGNMAAVSNPMVYISGGNAINIFGGSNTNGTINESHIEMTGGQIENIFGGNNQGGTTIKTNININGGDVLTDVYGGGNMANTTESHINLIKADNYINNAFGGGYSANVDTSNILLDGANVNNIYGGSNTSGTVSNSNVIANGGKAINVYGGNNEGGSTIEANVTINTNGQAENVYGGGDQAITEKTNVIINGNITGNVYGGGNRAGVNTDTNLYIENAKIAKNVYGGGNEGIVQKNTYVHVKNAELNESIYSGGNGATAIVYGNTNIVIEGKNTKILKSVFGGGNKAATGEENVDTSVSTINIVSGEIGGNVYGGANTSVVYGTTQTNIGYDAVKDNSLEIGNIHIAGTVFGGGEANESGSEIYDFSFISVTKGIDIQINGNGHEQFDVDGSIFGSGNASSTSGTSYITIQNYGTVDKPKSNISIQRTNCATISNSAIALAGATDRTNEYSDEYFTISRVDQVKLKNNSTLYLNYGANLLKDLESLVDENGVETKGYVTINEDTNEVTKNVDNRIYMAEGKNLNIATNEQVTAYGQVHGMFFFGMFTNKMNPSTSTGLYNPNYSNGDEITNEGTFSSNSYAMAQHMENHDTTKDGFYTNYNNEGYIQMKYIETTPEDDVYYIWLVGEKMDVTIFEFPLAASKYATMGTYELSLKGFSNPNITFNLIGFSAGLDEGISLVDPDQIDAIAQNEEDANNIFGLSMESGNNRWQNKGTTTFLTDKGGTYTGNSTYKADNSTFTPTLNFYLFHYENITEEKLLGDVKIRLQALVPVDDLNYDISYIDINITMTTKLYQDNFYEAAITPGEEYNLFTSTPTSITQKSAFSTYYSLYINDFSNSEYYNAIGTDYRVLISMDSNNNTYSFPVNTRIVMIDLVTDKEYYYVVTEEDVRSNKFEYRLSDFLAMGSTNEYYNEQEMLDTYYNKEQDILYENFIFHIKLSEAEIPNDIEDNNLLMELRDKNGETLIGVLSIQRDVMQYSIYKDKDSKINISGNIDKTAYLGDSINLDVTTDFKQEIVNSKTIYDTEYFEKKMGIMLTIYDINGNKLSLDSLFGINFEIDEQKYYPRIDGTTRIKIADKVSNVFSKIKINTEGNNTLATGTYSIKIESFGSPDGIYYGLQSSASTEVKTTIINSSYGLKMTLKDEYKVIDKTTGNTLNNDNKVLVHLQYSSGLEKPNITISLYRRDYSEVYSQDYELVDFKDYFDGSFTNTVNEKEYVFSNPPMSTEQKTYTLKTNLKSGTYKIVCKLYDAQNYIGEDSEYIIIK